MLILGLESSCDETAAALVTGDRRVLAHKLQGQEAAHRPYGGVVPEIAARAHVEALEPLVAAALDEAGVEMPFPTSVVLLHDETESAERTRGEGEGTRTNGRKIGR